MDESTPPEDQRQALAQPTFRMGIRHCVYALLAGLFIAILSGWVWYNSDAPLRASIAEAKALGIETDILKVMPPKSAQIKIDAYLELMDIFENDDIGFAYSTDYEEDPDYSKGAYNVGCLTGEGTTYASRYNKLSTSFVAYYQQDDVLKEIRRAMELMRDINGERISFGELDELCGGGINTTAGMAYLFCTMLEYASTLQDKEYNDCLVLLLKTQRTLQRGGLMQPLVYNALSAVIGGVIIARYEEVDNRVIEEMQKGVSFFGVLLQETAYYDYLSMIDNGLWRDEYLLFIQSRYDRIDDYYEDAVSDIRLRLAHNEMLGNQLRLVQSAQKGVLALYAEIEAISLEYDRGESFLNARQKKHQPWYNYQQYMSSRDNNMHAYRSLLLAIKNKTPWPRDMYDPADGPLRPITEKGRIVAAYSVGENGIDDGWQNEDIYYPIYLNRDEIDISSP